MRKVNRVLAVCNDYDKCDMVLAKTAQIVKSHGCGVTVMFVAEEMLFALPIFRKEDLLDKDALRHNLKYKVVNAGMENAAVFVEENDTADRVALEAQKESDIIIVTHYVESVSNKIVDKTKIPILILKEGVPTYAKAVLALDAVMPEHCLDFMQIFFEGLQIHLYQDFQYIPMPTVDPVMEPYDVSMDATVFNELMKVRRENFNTFCREKGLKGTFEIGEGSIDEDIVAFAKKEDADLLVVAALDKDTILGNAVEDILLQSGTDILVCFEI